MVGMKGSDCRLPDFIGFVPWLNQSRKKRQKERWIRWNGSKPAAHSALFSSGEQWPEQHPRPSVMPTCSFVWRFPFEVNYKQMGLSQKKGTLEKKDKPTWVPFLVGFRLNQPQKGNPRKGRQAYMGAVSCWFPSKPTQQREPSKRRTSLHGCRFLLVSV